MVILEKEPDTAYSMTDEIKSEILHTIPKSEDEDVVGSLLRSRKPNRHMEDLQVLQPAAQEVSLARSWRSSSGERRPPRVQAVDK